MPMKPGIQLELGHQLTMTPQLQQAIRLLQLSTLELRQEIQEQLETNPLLEADEDTDTGDDAAEVEPEASDEEALPDELAVDADWDDYVGEPTGVPGPEDMPEDNTAAAPSLHEHLHWQLNLTPMSLPDRAIAWALIEGLNTVGYLEIELDEAARSAREALGEACPEDFPDEAEVLAVLHRIQHFDPPGVAARDLGECLRLQLEQTNPTPPWRAEAIKLLNEGQTLLERGDRAGLCRLLGVTGAELDEIMALIRGLNPSPGEDYSPPPETEIPDVIVRRRHNRWTVELNPEALPRLGINRYYAGLARSEADDGYLRARLQEARWLLKSLQSRNETLLRVAEQIVAAQQDFLDYGEEAMKPLVLADIAEKVEMHESTISRVTNRKYMATPRGLFELKYFFSSHVATEGGGECSSTAIRAIIRKLVAAEDAHKPLSDNKLAALLQERGIQVARRTVAKYRESLGIASSSERKRRV